MVDLVVVVVFFNVIKHIYKNCFLNQEKKVVFLLLLNFFKIKTKNTHFLVVIYKI